MGPKKRTGSWIVSDDERGRTLREELIRRVGPKTPDDSSVGKECPACDRKFEAGDFTTIVALGPGDDKEQQMNAREGRAYNAVCVEVHWSCATGDAT